MVATISPADNQYHHTLNTLKYADRAKEIRTHVQKNIGTVDTHVADYQRMIDNLQIEVCRLRKELAEKDSQLSVTAEKAVDDELSWLNVLSHETSENVQERINLQKALFELEETNLRNRIELQQLDDAIAKQQAIEKDGAVVQALRARRQIILDNIRDNDEAGINYQKEIAVNEKHRCQLQDMIEEAISNNSNRTYLRILSQYRLLGMANTELQFEMAIRDQVINNQRVTHRNLWNLLMGLGLDQRKIMELAAKQGISIEDWNSPNGPSVRIKYSPIQGCGRFSPICSCPGIDPQASASTACFFQHHQDFSSMASFKGQRDGHTLCREEHHSSYYLLSHEHTSSAHHGIRKQSEHWAGGNPVPCFYTPEKLPRDPYCCYSGRRALSFPWSSESCTSLSSFHEGYSQQQKDVWPENGQLLPEGASVAASSNLNPCKEIAVHSGAIRSLFQNSSDLSDGVPATNVCCMTHSQAAQIC